METAERKELKAREKQEVSAPAEQTRPGLVFTPSVDIFENDKEIVLLADMPGVSAKDLNIDLRDNILTLSGDTTDEKIPNARFIISEYQTGKYYRQFTISKGVNQEKIEANLKDGVLRLILPKIEKAMPRQITVHEG